MGGDQCSVPLCSSRRGKTTGISFHEFPSDENIRSLWLRNISRQVTPNNSGLWNPTDKSLICGIHFDPSAYVEGVKMKKLKKFAVPTVFPQFPVHLQSKIKRLATKRKAPPNRNNENHKTKTSKFSVDESVDCMEITDGFGLIRESKTITESKFLSPVKLMPISEVKKVTSLWGKTPSPGKVKKRLKQDNTQIARLREKVKKLTLENRKLKDQANQRQSSNILTRLLTDVENGLPRAAVLLEQLNSYGKKWHKWSEQMIRYCVLWRAKSARAYEYARKSGILRLPCSATLKSYIGTMNLNVGMNDLIKERLSMQLQNLSNIETYSSLIFDEMAIKPMLTYIKHRGQIFGEVDYGNYKNVVKAKRGVLANRLLCFLMKGISTNFSIPVAYFFVRQLKADELVILVKNILNELEQIGYKIIRLVGDDYKVNQKAFRILSGGTEAKPQIRHPASPTRPLFLCYDYCHIMKNIRNNFLGRNLTNDGKRVNSNLLTKLSHIQEQAIIKPVRLLTRKMLHPTNFEKMKVGTAVKLFGCDVTSALGLMKASDKAEELEIGTTIKFMETMRKWWELNDVCNSTGHVRFKNANREHYWNIDDTRLVWLQCDFIKYLDDWKESIARSAKSKQLPKSKNKSGQRATLDKDVVRANAKQKRLQYLTKDTDAALRLTTESTVLCIRHLIKIGFQYVLTRHFSSDAIEYTFSGIRQMGGRFDQMNAVSSMYAIEKILKIGLISGSPDSNVGGGDAATSIFTTIAGQCTSNVCLEWSNFLEIAAKILEDPPEIDEVTIQVAGSSMVAAYLCKVAKDTFNCPRATDFLVSNSKDSELCEFIRRQDTGGLLYPIDQLIYLVVATVKILEEYLPTIREWKWPAASLQSILLHPIQSSGIIKCGCESVIHSERLQKLLLSQLIKIFLQNTTLRVNEAENVKVKCQNKPASRKILKF